MDADRTSPAYELKNDLARLCLPAAQRDPNQKLAWVNSVCIVFLIIGLAGVRRGLIDIKPAPPLEQAVPVIVEPVTLPPQATQRERPEENKTEALRVNVVIPASPAVNFSVPTIGSMVVPANMAVAPPLEPMRTAAQINSLNDTGTGGDRPQPIYPIIARQMGEQGTVVILLTGDAAGNIVSVDVKESSGFPVLDRATVDFIKRHWRLPAGPDGGQFQSTITYRLQF